MKISELQARQTNVEVEGVITQVAEPREFEKFGKKGKVANAMLQDDSGEVKLSLWNEQIDQVKTGDRVKVQKGYVGEWQGELQLTTGKFGTLEVLGSGAVEKKPEVKPAEPPKKKDLPPPDEMEVTEDNLEEAEAIAGYKDEPEDKEEDEGLDVEEEEIR
ncbi:TPA: hypothetical protein HA265_08300 [Candidatus Woesearchaeota archaeon]|nr:hypothetical protein [Candidatus Woesearchaeota archaeon]